MGYLLFADRGVRRYSDSRERRFLRGLAYADRVSPAKNRTRRKEPNDPLERTLMADCPFRIIDSPRYGSFGAGDTEINHMTDGRSS